MVCVIMHISAGRTMEGVLLEMTPDRMRVSIPGSEDTLELRRSDGAWRLEDGTLVEFDALLNDGVSSGEELAGVYPRVQAAGRP